MTIPIESRTLDEQFTAVVFGDVARGDLADWLPGALATAHAYLVKWGAGPAGEAFVRFVGDEVEAGYPATTPVGGEGEVEPSELPAGSVAVTAAGADGVDAAFDALRAWIEAQGATVEGHGWEMLVDTDPSGRREVFLPYR